jgi:tungstate transport system ATP-binding protein
LPSTLFFTIFRRGAREINNDQILLELHNIKKKYDKEVLNIDELLIKQGQIHGIIGPSGAGKSTLLRIINLLTPPDSGYVIYKGKKVPANGQGRLVVQRSMALVFQRNLLFKESVYHNIAYGLKARGFKHGEIHKRVTRLLEQIGLIDLSARRADTLSGGEAQRVAIARAIAFEPELLLLDEPTANLDPANVEMIEKIIAGLRSSHSISVIMVTHNIFQAQRVADQVIFINQGKIVESGETGQIFNNPRFETTAAYIAGRMVY